MSIIRRIIGSKSAVSGNKMDQRLTVDIHSHLIPGIDDGCRDSGEVMEILHELYNQGIRKVITTPHVIYDLYPNTAEVIAGGEADIQKLLEENNLPIEFKAAAEYYIDDTFVERHLKGDDVLLTLDGRHVLVETNYVDKPGILEDAIYELKLKGHEVILAHPERYHYLLRNFNGFYQLKETGVIFQLNLMSFTGHYGPQVKKAAEFLLKEKLVDMVGSDIHKMAHARQIGRLKQQAVYRRLMDLPLLNKNL